MAADVSVLAHPKNSEEIRTMRLAPKAWVGRDKQPVLSRATRQSCELFVAIDHEVAEVGIVRAARWALSNLVRGFQARSAEITPHEGPVLRAHRSWKP